MGSSLKISSDMVLHLAGVRSQDKDGGNSARGSSVTSGKRAGLLAAPLAPGGAWDVSGGEAQEKEP